MASLSYRIATSCQNRSLKHNTKHNTQQEHYKWKLVKLRSACACMSTTELHEQICFSKQGLGKSSTAFCQLPNGCQGALKRVSQSHPFCHSLAADLLHNTSWAHSLSACQAYHLLQDPACNHTNCQLSESHSTVQPAFLSTAWNLQCNEQSGLYLHSKWWCIVPIVSCMHLEIYGSSLLLDILFLFCTLSFPGGCRLDLVVIIISLPINGILYVHSFIYSLSFIDTLYNQAQRGPCLQHMYCMHGMNWFVNKLFKQLNSCT